MRRARVDGSAAVTRVRRAPDSRLSGLLTRELIGYQHRRTTFAAWLEAPRPELTLMIDLEGWISVGGERLPGAWLGGLGDSCSVVGFGRRYGAIDLKLNPLGAYSLLGGMPLCELEGRCVALYDLFGRAGSELAERVREADDWDARLDLVEGFLIQRLALGPSVDPAVAWAWHRLRRTAGGVRISALAEELGCSRRHLLARFESQVGVGPKTAARLWRFAEVRRRIERSPVRWAEVAYEAGFADQSHLTREFRELAGVTPRDFVARLLPQGGVAGDGL